MIIPSRTAGSQCSAWAAADCRAAIALEHRATVATRNLRDFGRVPGLVIQDWTA
jgi:predicted nucleic acid-binding protein